MPANIEIKAFVDDLTSVEEKVCARTKESPKVLHQEDVFFHAPRGRLKLRILGDAEGELIWYSRTDEAGPKRSEYTVSRTTEPETLRQTLVEALGEKMVVRKTRRVYLLGQTRVHLDQVEGLGTFVELEVVLRDGQSDADGTRIADELIDALGIDRSRLVECAYADLLTDDAA